MEEIMMLLVLVLAASGSWITAAVQWFQHDDHAALGFLGLSMVLGNYTTVQARKWITKRRSL